ncbi:MAG: PHP domain-containing protein [Candidatus Thiodiazotropha sp. (ex Monitilora ramsayi)]|nr:PHP domain-containing protein [Candidatus Thiodiazotropha sp. (ex Monitilora ramsayi)]
MFCRYDLHSHSTASDGTLSPAALVRLASEAGVQILALTDHDTVAGIREAREVAETCGIQLISGVEVSVTWSRQTVHIVGLNVDTESRVLGDGLQTLRDFRDWRAREIGKRLQTAGIQNAFEGALAHSNGTLVSRTHFARMLVERGVVEDERKVFKHYLVQGKPGHVPGNWASLENALEWIHQAGGEAVIAHPARYKMTRTKLRRLFGEFQELGGEAIEVVSGSHGRDDCISMAKHTNDFGLLASAGSDFHSPENPWVALGRLPLLPGDCRPIWDGWSGVEAGASRLAG